MQAGAENKGTNLRECSVIPLGLSMFQMSLPLVERLSRTVAFDDDQTVGEILINDYVPEELYANFIVSGINRETDTVIVQDRWLDHECHLLKVDIRERYIMCKRCQKTTELILPLKESNSRIVLLDQVSLYLMVSTVYNLFHKECKPYMCLN